MSARLTRRAHTQAPLTTQESLLLAQAVWEVGAGPISWPSVAKLLSKHPLLSRPKTFFNAQSCHAMYEQLMKDAELELDESNHAIHAPMNLKLAEKHYRSRHNELRELIIAEESKFRVVLKEIEDIRAGLWDKEIQNKLAGEPALELPNEQEPLSTAPATDAVFDRSELSGVTESADSSSSPPQTKDDTTSSMDAVQEAEQAISSSDVVGEEETKSSSPSSPYVVDEIAEPVAHDEMQSMEIEGTRGESHSPTGDETEDEKISTPSSEEVVATSAIAIEVDAAQVITDETHKSESEVVPEVDESMEIETADTTSQHVGKRQEEEEEIQDEETKEEEEEDSQGIQEEASMSIDHEENEKLESSDSTEKIDADTEYEPIRTPVAPLIVSETEPEPEPAAEERQSSDSEEEVPIVPARRSSRRRKSSAASIPPPKPRTRLRSQGRVSVDRQSAMDSEDEDEAEIKDDGTPQPDDETSSPFDGSVIRRGKRKASFLESVDSPIDKKRPREDSEPAEEEELGPSSHNTRARVTRHATRTEEQVALKRFQSVIGMLHSQISQHRNGNIFHNPIKNSEAPDYHEIVKRPMDLKTIKTRVKDGVIANSLEYQRDIFLMFANAMMYNRPGSDVHGMAEDMMLESEAQISTFRQTEGLVKRGQRP